MATKSPNSHTQKPATIFALLVLFVAIGCAKRESTVARANRDGVLHMSIGAEPSDLDPQTVTGTNDAKIIQSLFEPLVSYEPGTLAPVPALAARWEISADGLTYTFHLRPDAKWSNGDPLTAQDCVDSTCRNRCGSTAQCTATETCRIGYCLPGSGPQCVNNCDCIAGQRCLMGVCAP